LGRTAGGRGKVRLQWEVKPLGVPFDATSLVTGAIHDTGAPSSAGSSVQLEEIASGLSPGTFYHWRARIAAKSPFFPRSPWLSIPDTAGTETDRRTGGCHDADGDGYGSPGDPTCPAGAVGDCNDSSAASHPGAAEVCDGLDNNCDGVVDNAAAPAGGPLPPLVGGAAAGLSGTPLAGATVYDVVRGDAAILRSSGGNFPSATAACSANDQPATIFTATDTPAFGQATWYIVRGQNCG